MQKHINRKHSHEGRRPRALLALALALLLLCGMTPGFAGAAEGGQYQGQQPINIVITPDGGEPYQEPASNPDAGSWTPPSQDSGSGGSQGAGGTGSSGSNSGSGSGSSGSGSTGSNSGSGSTGSGSGTDGSAGTGTKKAIQLSSWISDTQGAWQVSHGTAYEDIGLPVSLRAATATGGRVWVPVQWRTETGYDPTVPDTYIFTAYARDEGSSTYWQQLMKNMPRVQRAITVMRSGDAVTQYKTEEPTDDGWDDAYDGDWQDTDPAQTDPGMVQGMQPVIMNGLDSTEDGTGDDAEENTEDIIEETDEQTGDDGIDAGYDWVIGIAPPESTYHFVSPGTALSALNLPTALSVVLAPVEDAATMEAKSGENTAPVWTEVPVSWNASPAYDPQAWADYMAARAEIEAQAGAVEPQVVVVGAQGVLTEEELAAQQATAAQEQADRQAAIDQALAALTMPPTSYTFTADFGSAHVPVNGLDVPVIQVDIDAPADNVSVFVAGDEMMTMSGGISLFAAQGAIVKDAQNNEYRVINSGTSPQQVVVTKVVAPVGGALSLPLTFAAVTPDTLTYELVAVQSGAFPASAGITHLHLGSGISYIQSGAFAAGSVSSIDYAGKDLSFIASGAFPAATAVTCPPDMVYGYRRLGFTGAVTASGDYSVTLTGAANAEVGMPYTLTVTFGCAFDKALTPSTIGVTVGGSGGTVSAVNFTPYNFNTEAASLTPMSRTATVTIIPTAVGTMTIDLPAAGVQPNPSFFGKNNAGATAPLSVTVAAATARINTLTADPATLPHTGGNSVITLAGYNLNLLTSMDLRGYGTTPINLALVDNQTANATLSFPANTTHSAQVYTLQLWVNGTDTGKRVTVKVAPKAWVDYIKADKTRLYRGGGTVKVTIYGENLDYFDSLAITTNDRHPVDATVVKGSGGTRATASIKIGKNTTKGTLYYDLRLWVDGVATDHVVEVKQYNYYADSGTSPTATPAPAATLNYTSVYQYDQLGAQRGVWDLSRYQMDTQGMLQVQAQSITTSHSYLVSIRELTDFIGKDVSGMGGLQLNTTLYSLRIPYRVLMQPVISATGATTEELLPNVTDYLRQNNLQTGNLWMRVGLTPMAGGGYQVVLSLEYQLRTSTTNETTMPLTVSVPVVLTNLSNPLQISQPNGSWEFIPESGLYLMPYGTGTGGTTVDNSGEKG